MQLSKFKDKDLVLALAQSIKAKSKNFENLRIMHVCGTHENSIVRYALRDLLPENIKLLAGPGCPVCVTSSKDIDAIINYGIKNNCTIATFGDMLRVKGSNYSLFSASKMGLSVKMVYGLDEAIDFAKKSRQDVIFFSVGFETTAAPIASIIKSISLPENLSFFSVHKYTPNGVLELLKAGKLNIDALILPGHASIVSGLVPYEKVSSDFKLPCVAAGFEPADILSAILMIINQIENNTCKVENEYERLLSYEGNKLAQKALNDVFDIVPCIWRGLGTIENSGFEFKKTYDFLNAKVKFNIPFSEDYIEEQKGCRCAEVILGLIEPTQCPMFSKVCNPHNPVGPCMVSDEGTCRNWWEVKGEI
ncbi:MAG: hydrogenase formation protein HypD [Desulfurella sp.]|uniref:hydrogenase formation protein HypD n=1 Tax=Desulfurella sp. TaxID=1962857 RepID=UPI003C78F887